MTDAFIIELLKVKGMKAGGAAFPACSVFCIPHVRMIPLAVFTVE